MAETFKNQVDALTGFAGTEDDALTDWLTAGAKELINIFPNNLKEKCSTITNLYIGNTNTTMDMDGCGEILYATRENANSGYYAQCRKIPSSYGDMSNDSSSLHYATATDPVYWIESNSSGASTLFVKPTPTAAQPAKIYHIGYPAVAHGDGASGIDNFPDEAEYLVVLYASVKALQRLMNNLNSNTDIDTTAFAAVNTELDETQAICDLINTQVDSAVTELAKAVTEAGEMITQTDNSGDFETALDAINTAVDKFRADGDAPALFGDQSQYTTGEGLTHVKDALELARDAIDTGFTTDEDSGSGDDATPKSVGYWLADEDPEMVQATLSTAQTEIQRAQAHIGEWSTAVQTLQAEINGFAAEVQSRASFTGAKGGAVQAIVSEASGYLNAAQGYGAEIQSKIAIAQGYVSEANVRMQRDSQKYQWYQAQQLKLQQDYDKGLQMLITKGAPQQAQQGAR